MLSDLYISGNTYFGTSSIGSYLKINDFNSTITTNFYNLTQTNNLINNLIANAPNTLDTLQDIATAINNDPNYAVNMANLIFKKMTTLELIQTIY